MLAADQITKAQFAGIRTLIKKGSDWAADKAQNSLVVAILSTALISASLANHDIV